MRTTLLALVLLAGPSIAQAQTQAFDYRIAHISDHAMSVVDVAHQQRKGQQVLAATTLYYASTQNDTSGVAIDYTVLVGEYDCTQMGKWRPLSAVGFTAGKEIPSLKDTNAKTQWVQADEGSIGQDHWVAVCRGLPANRQHPVDSATFSGRELALRSYRKALANGLQPAR